MTRRYVSDTVVEFIESSIFAQSLLSEYREWNAFSPELEAELEWAASLSEVDFCPVNVDRIDAAISEAEAIRDALDENIFAIEHTVTVEDGVVRIHHDYM